MTIIYHSQIQQLYIAYFKRPADPAGLAYWQNALDQGAGNLALVSAAFAASAEYKAAYAGLSAPAVIEQIYLNLFGRAAEPAGQTYWAELLAGGKLSIDNIVKNVADGALSSDKAILSNKVQAALAFTGALDTPAEAAAYNGAAVNQQAKAFIASIASEASLADALRPATLDQIVSTVLQPGGVSTLSAGLDKLASAGFNISYKAPLIDGAGSLQTGDLIAAGAGKADRLDAQLGNQKEVTLSNQRDVWVHASTSGIETVAVQALALAPAPGTPHGFVEIYAPDMTGVKSWESQRSNAYLLINGAHVDDSALLADVRIVMRETDAGNAHFGVYFDAASLRDRVNPHHELRAQLINPRHEPGQSPLSDLPYDGIAVSVNGVMTTLASAAIDAAENYDQLLAAFQAVVAATPGMEKVTVSKGMPFYLVNTLGKQVQGVEIVFSSSTDVFDAGPPSHWTAPGIPQQGLHNLLTTDLQAPGMASVQILLDEVGRGGIGGELLVGGADKSGVGRFLIEVGDDSALQSIASNTGALREVILHNGETSNAVISSVKDRGNLSVQGAAATGGEALPGVTHSNFGFTDVGKIDASAMLGKISYTAQLSAAAVALYPAVSGAPTYQYLGGTNDDRIQLSVDSSVLAVGARLNLSGGAGNDELSVTVTGEARAQVAIVTLNGGEGSDTLRASAGSVLEGGAGHDLLVLATAAGRDILRYADSFGNDTVQNFVAGDSAGHDVFDFSSHMARGAGFSGNTVSNAAQAITVQHENETNDSLARIAALYVDESSAASRIFIAYNDSNVGKVYNVLDDSASPVTVVLLGTITLVDTHWANITAANFM